MKILNKIIESGEFGNVLFGDFYGDEEKDTEIEKRVFKNLQKFFEYEQDEYSKNELDEIVKDINLLYKSKGDFPSKLIPNVDEVFRYITFDKSYNYKFNFQKTLKSFNNPNGFIYLCSFYYGGKYDISSWTTKPHKEDFKAYFNHSNSVLLKSTNIKNVIFNVDTSNYIAGSKSNENEVIKITNKKPEMVDIVIKNGVNRLSPTFIQMFVDEFNKIYNTSYKENDLFISEYNGNEDDEYYSLNYKLMNNIIK